MHVGAKDQNDEQAPIVDKYLSLDPGKLLCVEEGTNIRSNSHGRIKVSQTTPLSATSKALLLRYSQHCKSTFSSHWIMETYSSSFCAAESCLKSIPKISVPIAGVKWVTLLAARKRLALVGSADNPRSTTSISSSGSQDRFGNEGLEGF